VSAPPEPPITAGSDERETPPVFGSWPRAYALVIGVLILGIALLALLSRGCT